MLEKKKEKESNCLNQTFLSLENISKENFKTNSFVLPYLSRKFQENSWNNFGDITLTIFNKKGNNYNVYHLSYYNKVLAKV